MDVLRACIPQSRGVFKQGCTRFGTSSGQAEGTWCVCGEDLCNSTEKVYAHILLVLLSCVFIVFQ